MPPADTRLPIAVFVTFFLHLLTGSDPTLFQHLIDVQKKDKNAPPTCDTRPSAFLRQPVKPLFILQQRPLQRLHSRRQDSIAALECILPLQFNLYTKVLLPLSLLLIRSRPQSNSRSAQTENIATYLSAATRPRFSPRCRFHPAGLIPPC